MSIISLYGLPPPDVKAELNLKAAEPIELIEQTYKIWLDTTEKLRKNYYETREPLYQQACEITRSLAGKLKEKLHTDELRFLKEREAGLYLSALLNETNLEKLAVGKLPFRMRYIGYRLKKGKNIEILKDGNVHELGEYASGGQIVNFGNVKYDMGLNASGGEFVNFGKVDWMGWSASGGLFLNNGKVEWGMGTFASGGTFITRKIPDWNFMIDGEAIGVGPKELKKDKELGKLVDEILQACKSEEADTPRIEELARKVDGHVRANYPRRVA